MFTEKFLYPIGLIIIDIWVKIHLLLEKVIHPRSKVWLYLPINFIIPGIYALIFYLKMLVNYVWTKIMLVWNNKFKIYSVCVNFIIIRILMFLGVGYVNFSQGYYHVSYYDHLGTIRHLKWKKARSPRARISKVSVVDDHGDEVDITPFIEKYLGPDQSFPNIQLTPSSLNFQNVKITSVDGNDRIIEGDNILKF